MAVRVIALVAAYNEADIIEETTRDLIDQGIEVYLLDDGSTDGTADRVRHLLGRGLLAIESMPSSVGRPSQFYWRAILRRKEELAATLKADWFIHHDADEIREAPWPDTRLATAIERVDEEGWNAVDFLLLNFVPTEGDVYHGNLRADFPFYAPAQWWDRPQIRCWKRQPRVDLASTGGHDTMFEGRRVCPTRFLLRHYPIRSQEHGMRKVFAERLPRFDSEERAAGWHVQYNNLRPDHGFVGSRDNLTRYDPIDVREQLKAPLVSVIIPCHNLGKYITEAVESVLHQTIQDFEILIVDDGSTDEQTVEVLKSARWPRTTIHRTENKGLAQARNFLIARARGTYLCALDADDKLDTRFFEKTLEAFARDPGLTFVSTRLQMFGIEDRQWPSGNRCDLSALLCDVSVIPALVRRDAVQAVGGYDEGMPGEGNEDWDLWISVVESGHRGVILPEVLFYYRRRHGSMAEQCNAGERRLQLMDYMVRKHGASYRQHLIDVLLWKEGEISELRRANLKLEREIHSELEPMVASRRAELQALREKLGCGL